MFVTDRKEGRKKWGSRTKPKLRHLRSFNNQRISGFFYSVTYLKQWVLSLKDIAVLGLGDERENKEGIDWLACP